MRLLLDLMNYGIIQTLAKGFAIGGKVAQLYHGEHIVGHGSPLGLHHTDIIVGKSLHGFAGTGMFPQHGPLGANETGIKSLALLLRQSQQTVTSCMFGLRRYHIRYLQRLGAGPFAVAEHMELGNGQ